MTDQSFKYIALDAQTEFTSDLSSTAREANKSVPTLVSIECACSNVWRYRVITEGLGYARVTCPNCGRSEAYAGHIQS